MKAFRISILMLFCITTTQASSESSHGRSKSERSNDVSSLQASSVSEVRAETNCTALRISLKQAINAGPLNVGNLLADASLTSLNERLNDFIQAIRNVDVRSQFKVREFVKDLQGEVKEVIDECDLDSDEGFDEDDLEALLDAAFDVLLQDLINGLLGCFAVEDFLLNEIIFRVDRPNFTAVNLFLNTSIPFGPSPLVLVFNDLVSVFNLSFHDENVARFLAVLNGLPVFAEFNADLTMFLADASSSNFFLAFFQSIISTPVDGRDAVLEIVANSSISTLRLQFTEIFTNTCNLDLSTEQEEAVFDWFETDVRAVTLAAVECEVVDLLVNSFLPAVSESGLTLVFIAFLLFAQYAPTNFPVFTFLLIANSSILELDFSLITNLAIEDDLRSSLLLGIERCIANFSDEQRSDLNDAISMIFVSPGS